MAGSPKKRAKREAAEKGKALSPSDLATIQAAKAFATRMAAPDRLQTDGLLSGETSATDLTGQTPQNHVVTVDPSIAHTRRRIVMQELCERVANGASLRRVTSEPGFPTKATILRWVLEDPEIARQYTTALQMRAAVYADETVELSDMALGCSNEGVAAIKLMVNTRQWVASRLLSRQYGDHQTVEHTGTVQMDAKQVDQRLAYLIKKLAPPKPSDDVATD